MPLLINVFNRPKLKDYKKSIFNVYDQEYNKNDGEAKEVWKKMRDLNLVWADDRAKKLGFGPKNTLMIDSEYEKVRDFLDNSLLIKPFELDDLKNQTTDNALVFKQLENYIYKLADESEDVQEFLRLLPYKDFLYKESGKEISEKNPEEEAKHDDVDALAKDLGGLKLDKE